MEGVRAHPSPVFRIVEDISDLLSDGTLSSSKNVDNLYSDFNLRQGPHNLLFLEELHAPSKHQQADASLPHLMLN